MHSQYVALIAEMDKNLAMVRTFWIESRDDLEKSRNMKRLNELLDERIRLMKARDAAELAEKTGGAVHVPGLPVAVPKKIKKPKAGPVVPPPPPAQPPH